MLKENEACAFSETGWKCLLITSRIWLTRCSLSESESDSDSDCFARLHNVYEKAQNYVDRLKVYLWTRERKMQ
jgi:hypothetical protein